MVNVCFSAESWAVNCIQGETCGSRLGGSCDHAFGGLEVLVAEHVINYVDFFSKNVTYTCMQGASSFLEDAASAGGSCDMYIGSLTPFRYASDGLVFATPYFVGGIYAVFDSSKISYRYSGFEFVNPFSWTLWLAIAAFSILLPVVSTILEKDPGETWVDSYFTFFSDAWHAISGVDTLERGDDVNILSACLSIVTAVAARVLNAIYAANIATYLLSRREFYPDFREYDSAKSVGVSSVLSLDGVTDELCLRSAKKCGNAYLEIYSASVPYSIALPRERTTLAILDGINTASADVATHAEIASFDAPGTSVSSCSTSDGGISLGSTKYVFLIYMTSCAAIAVLSYGPPACSLAYRALVKSFSRSR